jgi:transcriptional regulator
MDLIKEYSFATFLTEGRTELISHLPVIISSDENGVLEIIAHCARANPHWRELKEVGTAKVIFQGPHGYISPAWYEPAKDNVPTWNYAVVHAKGSVELIEEPKTAYGVMNKMVNNFEASSAKPWILPDNEPEVNDLMRGIVVFKIKNITLESKFKLSQNRSPAERNKVIQELNKNSKTADLATYMEKVTKS